MKHQPRRNFSHPYGGRGDVFWLRPDQAKRVLAYWEYETMPIGQKFYSRAFGDQMKPVEYMFHKHLDGWVMLTTVTYS